MQGQATAHNLEKYIIIVKLISKQIIDTSIQSMNELVWATWYQYIHWWMSITVNQKQRRKILLVMAAV